MKYPAFVLGDTIEAKRQEARALRALERKREKARCEGSLVEFMIRAWPEIESGEFSLSWHHEEIAAQLEAITRGEIRNLVINVPPRCTKTLLCNVFYPAWVWAQSDIAPLSGPQVKFLCVSYGATLSEEIAVKMRRLVMGAWYQGLWGASVQIAEDQQSRANFANTRGGERMSSSIEGGLLGRGGDCLPGATLVETTSGPKRIDCLDISAAPEHILSHDQDHKTPAYHRVIAIARRHATTIWRIRTRSGNVVEATGEHRFFTGRGFVPAAALAVGDILLRAVPQTGRPPRQRIGEEGPASRLGLPSSTSFAAKWDCVSLVEEIRREEVVYDLQVEETETFFANGILVHNCTIVDDPHSLIGAESDVQRRSTIEGMRSLVTRITDPRTSARLLVMQRLHQHDATDYALENWGSARDPVVHLMFPMRFDERRAIPEDPRQIDGELLWPDVWAEDLVAREERELGSYGAAGQLQQSPVPRGGGIILREWWRLWPDDAIEIAGVDAVYKCSLCKWVGYVPRRLDEVVDCPNCGSAATRTIPFPQFSFRLLSVDTNFGDKEENSWSAATSLEVWHGKDDAPRIMLAYAWRGRPHLHVSKDEAAKGGMGLVERIHDIANRRKSDVVLIEKKTRGQDLYDELARQSVEWPYRLEWWDPTGRGDKAARLNAVSGLFANDLVWAPNTVWAETVITEVVNQPRAQFSDLADTVSQGLLYLRNSGMLPTTEEHSREVRRSLVFRGNRPGVASEIEGL